MFDPNVYAALVQANPQAAQSYLEQNPVNPPAAQAQAQPGVSGQPQPAAAPQPAARGNLDSAWNQGLKAGGHGPAAKFPAVGHKIVGVLARDILDTDVTQETDYSTKQPKFYRDGNERWQMTLPLNVAVSPAHPEGKVTVWAKTRLFQSVIRAAFAAGYKPGEGLRQGDVISIERVADVPSNSGNPAHDFSVQVTRASADPTPAAAPATATTPATTAPSTTASAGDAIPPTATPASTPAAPSPEAARTAAPSTPAPAIEGLTEEQARLVAQYTSAG